MIMNPFRLFFDKSRKRVLGYIRISGNGASETFRKISTCNLTPPSKIVAVIFHELVALLSSTRCREFSNNARIFLTLVKSRNCKRKLGRFTISLALPQEAVGGRGPQSPKLTKFAKLDGNWAELGLSPTVLVTLFECQK